MARHGVVVATLLLALLLGGGSPAYAQPAMSGVLHRVELQYWSAGGTGPGAPWTSNVFRLQYSGVMRASPFGLRTHYLSGGVMGETFWAIDLTYRPFIGMMKRMAGESENVLIRGTVGYGSFRWNDAASNPATSAGFGIGTEATFIIASPARGGKVALVADYVTYPSNSTTAFGGSGTGPASAWSVGIRYKLPATMGSVQVPGTTYVSTLQGQELLGAEWDIGAGFRSVSAENPGASTYRWSGFYFAVGKTF